MAARKRGAADPAEDPNRLVRQAGGAYRSADERFEVRKGGAGWSVVDTQVSDELGQPMIRGPFPSLDAVREALPEARRATFKPLGEEQV